MSHGLLFDCAIPLTAQDESANKQLAENAFSRRQHSTATISSKESWTEIVKFTNPRTKQQERDEIMTHLVKTNFYGVNSHDVVSWVGVCAIIRRINMATNEQISDTSVLMLTPREVLALIHYLAPPGGSRSSAAHTCIQTELQQVDTVLYTLMADTLYKQTSSSGTASEDTVKRLMRLSKEDRVTPAHGKLRPPPTSLQQLLEIRGNDTPDGDDESEMTTAPSSTMVKKKLTDENSKPPLKRIKKRVVLRDIENQQDNEDVAEDDIEADDAALLELDI